MSEKRSQKHTTLADRLLKDMLDTHRAVSVYLVNGFQLKGQIVGLDEETILIKLKGAHQLVMRSAVATMYPIPDSNLDTAEWWTSYESA